MILRRALLAAAAPLLLAACPVARMHVPEVEVRLAVPTAGFAVGDTVRLVGTLRNTAAEPVTLEFGTACWLHFYVLGADQRAIHAPDDAGCPPQTTRVTLAPGEERSLEERWHSAELAGGGTAAAGPLTTYVVLEEHYLERGGERVFKAGHRFGETQLRPRAAPGSAR